MNDSTVLPQATRVPDLVPGATLFQSKAQVLILASGSTARRALLTGAGLRFEVRKPEVDESPRKQHGLETGESADDVALGLAALKAGAISAPDALVVGADQMLSCEGQWFDKPVDLAAARTQLLALRGRTHTLHSALVLCRNGQAIWQHVAQPTLTMRMFSESFLDAYLEQEGTHCLSSVGAYRLEGPGIQLFERIGGDHSAILGLPLLPLFAALRQFGMLMA